MISLLTPNREPDFITACGFDKISGARLYTLFRCYGHNTRICLHWLQTDSNGAPSAALSLFDSRLSVSAKDEADFDELSAFADMIGGFTRIEASPRVCEAFGRHGGYSEDFDRRSGYSNDFERHGGYIEAFVMRYNGSGFGGDFSGISQDAGLREIYDILAAIDAGFSGSDWASWYTHTSRLLRNSLGSAAVIRDDGQAVATAGIYTMSINNAIIGDVATLPDYRGKGYAKNLVKHLVNHILKDGREPLLLCRTDKLVGYYARMGFVQDGKHGEI